jgi:GAF domain-containing protein
MNVDIGTIIPLAAVCGYSVLIGLAAWQGLVRRVNRLFIWYGFLLMMWSFGSFVMHAYPRSADILFWDRFLVVSATFGSVALFHFVRVFLGKSQPLLWLSLGYGLCALFALLTIMGYTVESASYAGGEFQQELGAAGSMMWLISGAFAAAAIFNLVRGYRRERDPFARNRIAYPLVGIGFAYVLSASNIVPSWRWYPIDHGGNMVNVALLSYAVLRFRLLDINIVFRRGLVYSLRTLVIGGFFVGVGVAWLTAVGGYDLIEWVPSVVVALLLAIVIPLLYRLMRRGIDPLFGGGGSDYRHVLRTTSRAIGGMPDLEGQASWLIDNIMRTIGAARGGLFLLDEEEKRYLPQAMRGYDSPALSQLHLESDNPVVGLLAKSDRCLVSDDLDRMALLRALWKVEREQLEELETKVLVPVRVKDNLIGVMLLGPKCSQRAYTVGDLEFLYTVANQAGVAIENTRLYQETKDRAEWIDMINRLTQVIGSSLDFDQVYETFTSALKNLVDFDRISIGLIEGDKLSFLAASSEEFTGLGKGTLVPINKSFATWAIDHKSTNVEYDFAEERQFPIDEILLRGGLRSAIRVPLFSKGEVFGTLNLSSQRPNAYGEREQKILEQIAGQLAVAIQNAMLGPMRS